MKGAEVLGCRTAGEPRCRGVGEAVG